jgi:hypothetical protein
MVIEGLDYLPYILRHYKELPPRLDQIRAAANPT